MLRSLKSMGGPGQSMGVLPMAEPTGPLSMQKYVCNTNFWPKLISEMKSTCNFGLVKVLKIYFSCRPGPIGAGPGLLAEASK